MLIQQATYEVETDVPNSAHVRLVDGFQTTRFVSVRSPDAACAWVSKERWEAVAPEDRQDFAPLCPDFVVAIRSKSGELKDLRDKMEAYRNNGVRLGWLVDRANQQVVIYRENGFINIRQGAEQMSTGEDMLPGLTLALTL